MDRVSSRVIFFNKVVTGYVRSVGAYNPPLRKLSYNLVVSNLKVQYKVKLKLSNKKIRTFDSEESSTLV